MAHVDLDGNNTLDFQVSLLPGPLALSPAGYVVGCWDCVYVSYLHSQHESEPRHWHMGSQGSEC